MKNKLKKFILSSRYLTRIVVNFHMLRLKRKFKIDYGRNVFISLSTLCEGRNNFGSNSVITSSKIGYASYISNDSKISKAKIGRYCSIGPNVNCIFGKHPSDTFVATHPVFYSKRKRAGISYTNKQLFEEFEETYDGYSIFIGNDVWIGANVSIMEGVSIGDGAIIASNALVNKNVLPYTIVGGVPAKIIKKRFSDLHIDFLLKFKWWDKNQKWIESNAEKFIDISLFHENFKDV